LHQFSERIVQNLLREIKNALNGKEKREDVKGRRQKGDMDRGGGLFLIVRFVLCNEEEL
jgi:hypothetical protein